MLTRTPTPPIWLAMVSSLCCRGVISSSMLSFCSAYPDLVWTPTAQTIARPLPEATRVLARRKGFGLYMTLCSETSLFSTCSGSPVRAASSAEKSMLYTRTQSPGILFPASSLIRSPTTSSYPGTVVVMPSLPLNTAT